jgi:hypothetical protein
LALFTKNNSELQRENEERVFENMIEAQLKFSIKRKSSFAKSWKKCSVTFKGNLVWFL